MRLLAVSFVLVVAACTTELDGRPADRHAPSAQALDVGSCLAACGGLSDDGCWCDDACEGYGDCCPDYVDQCTIVDDTAPCATAIKCAVGYEAHDDDGDGCADGCAPVAGCAVDEDCADGEHCQVIYCLVAPCPPASCVADEAPVEEPACAADDECPNGYCESFMSCLAVGCPPPPPNACVVPTGCGDGSLLLCAVVQPQCAGGTTAAVVDHCWQCVDARNCVVAPPPPADDSCVDRCGDEAPAGCWCDANCGYFEDCCADVAEQCTL
jgi:hypothetical protein